MAVPTVVASSTSDNGGVTDTFIDIVLPAGIQADDVIFLLAMTASNLPSSGFTATGYTTSTLVVNNGSTDMYARYLYKKATGSESSTTVRVSMTNSSYHVVIAVIVRGADGDAPLDVDGGTNASNIAPSVTTTVDDCLLLRFVAARNGTFPAPSITPPSTSIATKQHGGGIAAAGASYDSQASAGATATKTFTVTGHTGYGAYTIAVPPGGPSGWTVGSIRF